MEVSCTPLWSVLTCACLAFSFVSSIYIWSGSTTVSRDDPSQILRRFISVSLVSALAPFALLACKSNASTLPLSVLLGLPTQAPYISWLLALILPLLLTAFLFSGPLLHYVLEFQSLKQCIQISVSSLCLRQYRLGHIRNLVVGPFTEEWVFRSCMCSLLIGSGFSVGVVCLLLPALFGLAHLHHLIDHVRNRGISIQQAIAIVLFQLCYTTIFGAYTSFIFIRTGHFISCFLIHAFCNCMGFPDLSWTSATNYKHRKLVAGAYSVGILLFVLCLFPLTSPSLFESAIHSMVQN